MLDLERGVFFGSDVAFQKRDKILEGLRKTYAASAMPRDGEYEKTAADLLALAIIQGGIDEWFSALGLPQRFIPPERIHLLTQDGYYRAVNSKSSGCYAAGGIYVNKEYLLSMGRIGLVPLLIVMIHESLHFLSVERFRFFGARGRYEESNRSGYHISYSNGRPIFSGFNEMAIHQATNEVFDRIRPRLVAAGLWPARFAVDIPAHKLSVYADTDPLWEMLCEQGGLEPRAIFCGLFTGKLMYLRRLERFFGENALNAVAFFSERRRYRALDDEVWLLIDLLETEDRSKRWKLLTRLLNESWRDRLWAFLRPFCRYVGSLWDEIK